MVSFLVGHRGQGGWQQAGRSGESLVTAARGRACLRATGFWWCSGSGGQGHSPSPGGRHVGTILDEPAEHAPVAGH